MNSISSTVLHIDFEKTFRGAEHQLGMIHEGLLDHGLRSFCLCLGGSQFDLRSRERGLPGIYALRGGLLAIGEFNPVLILGAKEVIERVAPDIIHAHSAHAAGIALFARSILSSGVSRPKLIAHRTVLDPIGPLSKWKYNAMDLLIAVCGSIRDSLVASGVEAGKIRVVPTAVKREGCCPVEIGEGAMRRGGDEAREKNGTISIGTMCALDRKQKDVATLLRAFAIVADEVPNVHLSVFGDGIDRARLEAMAKELQLNGRVIFHGWWSLEPREALENLDIFVLSSLKEGSSNVLLSAMAAGAACVATSVGGNPEVLGGSGLLVPAESPEDMARAIKDLAVDSAKRRLLGQRAANRAKSFTLDRILPSLVACYEELIQNQL